MSPRSPRLDGGQLLAPGSRWPDRGAVASLAVDLVTGEVVRALREAGVPVILLKGPAIARWLYDEDGQRPYVDTDLLVPADRAGDARAVLVRLGFGTAYAGAPQARSEGVVWSRDERGAVDLHVSLPGLDRLPVERAWAALAAEPESLRVGGVEVEMLNPVARTLHLALHAAKAGVDVAKPREDLARGLERLPVALWEAAAGLARSCLAADVFAAGLRTVPAGASLAARLGLPRRAPPEYLLRAGERPPLAIALAITGALPGWGARLRYVLAKLWPSRGLLAIRYPRAAQGGLHVAAARLTWWGRVVRRLPAGYRSWRRAVREARRP